MVAYLLFTDVSTGIGANRIGAGVGIGAQIGGRVGAGIGELLLLLHCKRNNLFFQECCLQYIYLSMMCFLTTDM